MDVNDYQKEFETSEKAVTEISERLSKLRNISDIEKSEIGMLKSRIDEQSNLIMILKKRADENLIRCQAVEKINKDLEEFRDSAKDDLEMEYRRYAMLEQRFQELADNHEQMIRFKDQYKRQNEQLVRENNRLIEENKALFNAKIQEQEKQISDLTKRLLELKQAHQALQDSKRSSDELLASTRKKLEHELAASNRAVSELEMKLKRSEDALKKATEKQLTAESSSADQLKTLQKEKDDLLDLVMQRGKLVQDKQNEIQSLTKRLTSTEEKMKKMQQKFQAESDAVNVNATVARLRSEIEGWTAKHHDLKMEFDAYKKHTTNLLESERDLNARLRNTIR